LSPQERLEERNTEKEAPYNKFFHTNPDTIPLHSLLNHKNLEAKEEKNPQGEDEEEEEGKSLTEKKKNDKEEEFLGFQDHDFPKDKEISLGQKLHIPIPPHLEDDSHL
jgi:hypothetical protein